MGLIHQWPRNTQCPDCGGWHTMEDGVNTVFCWVCVQHIAVPPVLTCPCHPKESEWLP